jgi:hypothetical protein
LNSFSIFTVFAAHGKVKDRRARIRVLFFVFKRLCPNAGH